MRRASVVLTTGQRDTAFPTPTLLLDLSHLKGLFVFLPQAAEKVGFPLMIKASEGGGGKGIRKAESAEDFPMLFRQVRALAWVLPCLGLSPVISNTLPSGDSMCRSWVYRAGFCCWLFKCCVRV